MTRVLAEFTRLLQEHAGTNEVETRVLSGMLAGRDH
jgi:hypothetical protein